jgi:hypothetical protein
MVKEEDKGRGFMTFHGINEGFHRGFFLDPVNTALPKKPWVERKKSPFEVFFEIL